MFWKSSQNSQKNLRSSHPEVFCQRMFWKFFQNSQKNIFRNIFFNKVAGWKPETLRSRHFSHVTKSRIFKNLNLRKKSRSQLSRHFPEKPFQAPKIIFKSPKLIGQESLSYGHLLKDKRLKFTFLREPAFQVLVRRSSAPKKT